MAVDGRVFIHLKQNVHLMELNLKAILTNHLHPFDFDILVLLNL